MALPKIDLPTFNVFLSSLNKEIKFRPFIVKEEKLLLIAMESEDFETSLDAVKQVINNCVLTEGVDVDTMPLHEIEYLFLHLRARSMGEKIALTYVCNNVIESEDQKTSKCKGEMELEVDLLKTALDIKEQDSTLKITDKVGMKLRYPTVNSSRTIASDKQDLEKAVELIEQCTEYLYDDEQVYKTSDMAEGEFVSFLESLTQGQFAKIQEFFNNIPKIKYQGETRCGLCGKKHMIYLEGLQDFFE